VTFPRDQIRTVLIIGFFLRVTLVSAWILIGVWFALQLVSVGLVTVHSGGGVAYLAHVGGFVFGALAARLFEDPQRIAEEELTE
jgi:rhomboid family protein